MTPQNDGPWWITAVYRLGVPSAIAAFLLWYLVSNVSANIAAIRQDVRDHVMESIHNIGPLPKGQYLIGRAYDHPALGPLTMNLIPDIDTEMYGRSDFRIHGDSIRAAGTASHGCIVQDHHVREQVSQSDDKRLEVVA